MKWQGVKWSAPYCSLLCVRHHGQELKAAVLTLQYTTIRSLRHSTTRRGGQGEDDGDALPNGIYEFSSPLTFSHTRDIHAQNCKHSLLSGMRKCSGYGASPLNPLPGVLLMDPTGGFAQDPPWQHVLWHVIIFCTETALQDGFVLAEMEDLNGETIFCRHYRSIFNHSNVIRQQSYRIRWKKRKIMAITPSKVIQDHQRRYQPIARMRLPISDLY